MDEWIEAAGDTGRLSECGCGCGWMGIPIDPALRDRGVGEINGGLDAFGGDVKPVASDEGARWAVGRTGDVPLDGWGEWATRGVLAPRPRWVAGDGSRGSA